MHEALESNEFKRAVAAGERLLEIKSDHAEGARLLGEAQAKLSRTKNLAKRLEKERASLEQDQKALSTRKTSLAEKQSDLKDESEKLSAEQDEIEKRLEELEEERRILDEKTAEIEKKIEGLDKERSMHNRRAQRLSKCKALLDKGHLNQLEALLTHPIESKQEHRRAKSRPAVQSTAREGEITNRISCPECHTDNLRSERFCVHCGSRLDGGSAPLVATRNRKVL
jgi:chromosome segregation ATPase